MALRQYPGIALKVLELAEIELGKDVLLDVDRDAADRHPFDAEFGFIVVARQAVEDLQCRRRFGGIGVG